MSAYLLRRVLQMIPTLLGVVLLVFFLFTYVGGDPATILAGKIPSAAKIKAIREQLGLDQPVWVQLWIFIQQIVTFDFGRSWSTNEAVSAMLLQRAPVSLTVMGQVWLANFQNPNGLQAVGGNQWAATNASGAEQPNAPGTSNLGVVQSMAIEESNVDLTSELVSMITQQRAYQANAQSIKTQDQVLQTLVNLR